MANMFSGNQEKKIPKNFRECYQTDSITKNLWLWCERLEKWGFILCLFLGIIGIIQIISNGIEMSNLLDKLDIDTDEIRTAAAKYGTEIKSVSEVVVDDILKWSLYCFLEYCTYHILALLIGSLATIVQHTKITANITLYNSAKAEGIDDDCDSVQTEESDVDGKNNENKCTEQTHQKYIAEIGDIGTDSENAYWEESKLTGAKRLVCNHCGKELVHIDNQEIAEEDYKEVICPKCNRKLEFRASERFGKCPFCEIGFEIE